MTIGKRKTTSGNFLPLLRYDARSGSLYTQDRVMRDGAWQTEQNDVTETMEAIFDLPNAQIGWIKFPKGAAPEMVLKKAGEDIGERPSPDHKEGVRIIVKILDDDAGPRELASTAGVLWNSIDQLHEEYLAGLKTNPGGKLPVVMLANVNEVSTPSNTNYEPVFEIVRWVPRPADLPADGIPVTAAASSPAKPQKRGNAGGDMDDAIPF
jgi:hypothetical protein